VLHSEKDVHLIRQHFRLVLDQRLVDDLDCTSLLGFLVDSEFDCRKISTRRPEREKEGIEGREGAKQRVSVCVPQKSRCIECSTKLSYPFHEKMTNRRLMTNLWSVQGQHKLQRGNPTPARVVSGS